MKYAIITAFIAMTVLVGCSSDEGGETAAPAIEVNLVNTHCPIMGHEVTADGGRTEYNGGTVGFCCPGCVESFNELDGEAKDNALATKGKGIVDDEHDHDHDAEDHEHDHSDEAQSEAEATETVGEEE